MTAIQWGQTQSYSSGVDQGVLYLPGQSGIPWNGLVSVEEFPDQFESELQYVDGRCVGITQTIEDFAVKVSAFTYPPGFEPFSGYADKQVRTPFGFSYRTNGDKGQLHIVYNAIAMPSDKAWKTQSQTSDAALFEWNFSTTPNEFEGIRPTAHIVVDLQQTYSETVKALTDRLYGTSSTSPSLPDILGIWQIYHNTALFHVIDNGDGTWTATGPPEAIQMLNTDTFQITWDTIVMLNATTYTITTDI